MSNTPSNSSALTNQTETSSASSTIVMQSASVLFQEFNPSSEEIGSYLDRFDCFTLVNGVSEEKKPKLFIASVGASVYQRLLLLAIPKKPTELTFAEIETLLRGEYKKKPLTHVARHNFRQRKQKPGESFRDFYNSLKELSTDCQFEGVDTLREELKSQIISGIRDAKTQGFYFMQQKLTLDDVVKKAEIDEQAVDGVQHFRTNKGESEVASANVNKISQPYSKKKFPRRNQNGSSRPGQRTASSGAGPSKSLSPSKSAYVCFRCARQGHRADACFFRTATCNKCQKVGHIAAACGRSRESLLNKPEAAKVNQVEEPYEIVPLSAIRDVSFNDFVVEKVNTVRDPKEKVFTSLLIDGVPVVFEADSGSRFAIMSRENLRKINCEKPIVPCKVILQSYTGNFIFVVGFVNVNVTYNACTFRDLKLLIVNENYDTVFGREWWYAIRFDIFDDSHCKINKVDVPFDLANALNNIAVTFDDIFADENGTLKNVIEHVSVRPDVKPIFCRHRNVVYSLRINVSNEIDRLISVGIYKPITSSEWATPLVVVQKAGGAVRLVGDYSVTVNRAIIPEDYPIPNIEEILYDFGNCKYYSKFDIREAYMHMPVDDDTAKLLTVNTTKGLFKVTRLNYGIQSAPAKWQRYVETIFKPVNGCRCFYDDIKISSAEPHEHLARIKKFFEICRENGIKLRKSKCQFLSNELEYLGFRINEKGIHKTSEKVDAILKAPPPKNVTEVKSFTGLVVFYSRFLPNMSKVLHPINNLLRKETRFVWDDRCQAAFDAIKAEIASPRVLCHFDPRKRLILATDASPYAIGAVLSHQFEGGERPVAFASRSLSKTEENYSQIDKESLAIFWGVKRFFNYLFGRPFVLYVDCKPLQSIFARDAAKPALSATRLLHYALFLQGFDYEIRYRKSEDHSNADFLSRFPVQLVEGNEMDEPSAVNLHQLNTLPLSMQELAEESDGDSEIAPIKKRLQGRVPKESETKDEEIFRNYSIENGCVLHGTRVFVPKTFRKEILNELHTGHLGISKMKGLARSYVYWPGIDREIETLVRSCEPCQRNARAISVPSHPWEPPAAPWERVHIDYAGPFLQFSFLVVVDAFSKWPEVFPIPVSRMHGTNSSATIEKLAECFARFGCPAVLVSDNGVQFTSHEFREFCKKNFVKQIHSAPYHPQSNGQAERFVQTFKRALKIAILEKPEESIPRKLQTFLMAYRRAPLAGGESPCQLMLGRNVRSRIDVLKGAKNISQNVEPKPVDGSKIWFRVFSGPENWARGTLVRSIGAVMVEVRDCAGQLHRRHLSQVRKDSTRGSHVDDYPENSEWEAEQTTGEEEIPVPNEPVAQAVPEAEPAALQGDVVAAEDAPAPAAPVPRRSERDRRPPTRFSP